jgi:hypothetical protein
METSGKARERDMELRHLRRDVRTALELAVVTMAPAELRDRLATAAGLLETVSELPADSPPSVALAPWLTKLAGSALADWTTWRTQRLEDRLPRG